MFVKLKQNNKLLGTSLKGCIFISQKDLEATLGPPHVLYEGEKITMEWEFEDEAGNPVCIYDWCNSHLTYGRFNIGAHSNTIAQLFKQWIESQVIENNLLNHGG